MFLAESADDDDALEVTSSEEKGSKFPHLFGCSHRRSEPEPRKIHIYSRVILPRTERQ